VSRSLRTKIVHLNLRIEKLRKNPRAFDVPSDPAEGRAAADTMQVSLEGGGDGGRHLSFQLAACRLCKRVLVSQCWIGTYNTVPQRPL
jgi:hypothetical protein